MQLPKPLDGRIATAMEVFPRNQQLGKSQLQTAGEGFDPKRFDPSNTGRPISPHYTDMECTRERFNATVVLRKSDPKKQALVGN